MICCVLIRSARALNNSRIVKHSQLCTEFARDADTYRHFCVVAWFLSSPLYSACSFIVSASQSMCVFFCARLNMLRMRSLHVAHAWFAHNKVRIRASRQPKTSIRREEGRAAQCRVEPQQCSTERTVQNNRAFLFVCLFALELSTLMNNRHHAVGEPQFSTDDSPFSAQPMC